MSAVVKCAAAPDDDSLEIGPIVGISGPPLVYVRVLTGEEALGEANPTRADFLAAVSSELGVVIIDKADLPEAQLSNLSTGVVEARGFARALNADTAEVRAGGYALLAIADYIDGHVPPVDEAQVSALAEVIGKATGARAGMFIDADLTASDLARMVVATGKVEVRS